ncbi:toll/interleukin-1 receptor domain-containing protein [Mesorhizobium caraganae]|uniref:toll/interleukin-1 receptor domain-containing protein n=1 Tax=Mesorhizobium caraganae TaxID=483206 RepID=UPI00193ADACD|nr:toll/interleukin-1 receptor domain-containing protein [Mesorhizobium caraganae]MBM2715699.1 toll/interleukin-1 receptor domain-containing protein [Mesorhizobium caraganae]
MAKLFFSYLHKDEELRNRLEVALTMLQRQGLIDTWHDRRIAAGDEFSKEIDRHLEEADVILLLVSPDFLASDYCYDIEMGRAMERHRAGDARVIPVILRHCDWHAAPFGKLLATPTDGKPIKSYADIDEAFQNVTVAIRKALEAAKPAVIKAAPAVNAPAAASPTPSQGPRSSNLSLPKVFTDRDRDRFLEESFEYILSYFRNSLDELKARNDGIDTSFRTIDQNKFSAAVYRAGKELSRCTISLGSVMGKGIAYSNSDHGNSFNEQLSVDNDNQGLFLKSLGMASALGANRDAKLTQEGGAELLWGILIRNLQ